MPTLEPGRYLLVLHAPADGGAVRARPAVAGLSEPPVDPPLDVVRRYLEPDTPPTTFQSRYVEEDAPSEPEPGAEEPAAGLEDSSWTEEDAPEEEPPPTQSWEAAGSRREDTIGGGQ
jgi:hypothetical protein